MYVVGRYRAPIASASPRNGLGVNTMTGNRRHRRSCTVRLKVVACARRARSSRQAPRSGPSWARLCVKQQWSSQMDGWNRRVEYLNPPELPSTGCTRPCRAR